MTNQKLQQLREAIILALFPNADSDGCICYDFKQKCIEHGYRDLTIGRIMQALDNRKDVGVWSVDTNGFIHDANDRGFFWQLTKDNGAECHLEDQSDEVLFALYDIFL